MTAQPKWTIWRKKQRLENTLPESFDELLSSVIRFVDPAIVGNIMRLTWSPVNRTWS